MRALVSVFDKTGIVEFASGLCELGVELISTGGTKDTLLHHSIPVTSVSELTGYPEVLDGRVKTLHPTIHAAILAKNTCEHQQQLEDLGVTPIDIVVVNLYPFEAVSQDPKASFDQVVENIDIGGPTLLRAAAKNHQRVLVVSDPQDYSAVLAEMQQGSADMDLRRHLAAKAFAHTAYYDTLITRYLKEPEFPSRMTVALSKVSDLRYGENPHQSAAFYREVPASHPGLLGGKQLQGKPLSFNNLLDTDAACQMVSAFDETCVVAVKHGNPCGLCVAPSIGEAYRGAYEGDPISIFGGVVACNREVDEATATLMCGILLDIIVAPSFSEEARKVFAQKPNLRLLQMESESAQGYDWRRVAGGMLVQQVDDKDLVEDEVRVVTSRQPTDAEWKDLRFAWRVVKYVKSNAIVLCKSGQLVGVGAGQMNRVQSVRLSIEQAKERARGSALASDAFFPFADNIDTAAAAGVTAMIQPGGSVRDDEVVAACNRHHIAMVFTGLRHFRH